MFASVVLDIATRALDGAFDYEVPRELEAECVVGATVLVPFSHREAVGYVVATSAQPPDGLDAARVLPVLRVLAPSAFDQVSARVAFWMAREYACPPCEALRPFLAPGQTVRVRRASADDPW